MALFGNGLLGGQQQMPMPQLPRVPWSSNPLVTSTALGLLGGRNINEGLANAAAAAPAGMAAKSGMQQFMLAQQERQAQKAEQEQRRAAMNEVIKNWSGLNDQQRALFSVQPELFGQYAMESMAGGGNDASLVPIWGEGPDGQPMLVQPTKSGQAIRTQLPEGFVPSKGVEKIDAGTEWLLYDKQTGNLVGRQPKDIAGAEREKAIGAGQGDRIANLPKVEQQASTMLTTLDRLEQHPGFDSAVGFVGGLVPDWAIPPGTDMRGFNSLLKQVQGQSFLQAFESLKGGGQITEVEGRRATEAINRLERGLKPEEFRQAINEIREVINIGLERARRGVVVGAQPGATQTPAPPATDGEGWTEISPGVRIREVQ